MENKTYRTLEAGELTQDGDQFRVIGTEKWFGAASCIDLVKEDFVTYEFRRVVGIPQITHHVYDDAMIYGNAKVYDGINLDCKLYSDGHWEDYVPSEEERAKRLVCLKEYEVESNRSHKAAKRKEVYDSIKMALAYTAITLGSIWFFVGISSFWNQ